MFTDLENSLRDKSTYHIIKFYSSYVDSDEIFFLLDINEHGFVRADIFFPDELNIRKVLPKAQQIHYHNIYLSEPATCEITENIRIKVVFSDFSEEIILEADDQCWYVGVDDCNRENSYYQGKMSLLLFMRLSYSLHNGDKNKTIYPSFYDAQFRFFDHRRMRRHKNKLKSEEEKNFEEWEKVEYRKLADQYFHLLHFSHPKRFEHSAEKFKEWAKKQEVEYLKDIEKIKKKAKN